MRVDGLPLVADAALPADVRRGTSADKDAYRSALGFEQLLVKEVVSSMAGQDGALASGPYAGAVQDALTGALSAGGGLGLARTLYAQTRTQERAG